MSSRFISPFYDVGSGIKPPSGAQLFFFADDGVTPKDTFSDQLATPTPNENPVIADSYGVFGDIFIEGSYKVTLKDKNGTQIYGLTSIEEVSTGDFDSNLINDLSQAYEFATVALFKSSTISFPIGKLITIKDISTTGDEVKGSGYITLTSNVTPNDRNIILSTGVATQSLLLTPLLSEAYEAFVWHVDPINGVDAFGQGVTTGTGAFKTIQYAWDSLPTMLTPIFQQTLQLADGTYNTNPILAANQPRPALLWGKDKITTGRSTLNGAVLTGAVVIKGNPANRSLCVIKTGAEFTYGIYINKGNIGIQDVELQTDSTNVAASLLVAHRTDTYIQCYNVLIDGKDVAATKFVSNAIVAESGGQIELSNECVVKNGVVGAVTLTDGDNITISGNSEINSCDTGATITAGLLKLAMTDTGLVSNEMIHNCTVGIRGVFGQIDIRGADATSRAVIASPIQVEGSYINCVFADTLELVQLSNGSNIKYDSSTFQKQVQLKASTAWLRNANSYTDVGLPNNDDVIPLAELYGSSTEYEGTNNVVGSTGGPASKNPRTLTFNADSDIQPVLDDTNIYRINGNGAQRLLCEIEAAGITDGRTIYVDGDTWGVEFTSGTNMDIPTNFSIGSSAGQYTGAVFTMRSGRWRINSRGVVR